MPVRLPASPSRGPLVLRLWEPVAAPAMGAAIAANLDWLRPLMPWVAQEPLSAAERVDLIGRFGGGNGRPPPRSEVGAAPARRRLIGPPRPIA